MVMELASSILKRGNSCLKWVGDVTEVESNGEIESMKMRNVKKVSQSFFCLFSGFMREKESAIWF